VERRVEGWRKGVRGGSLSQVADGRMDVKVRMALWSKEWIAVVGEVGGQSDVRIARASGRSILWMDWGCRKVAARESESESVQ
jgi:hypothetical protein